METVRAARARYQSRGCALQSGADNKSLDASGVSRLVIDNLSVNVVVPRRVNSTVRHLSLMTQITYRDWILDCDVEATRAGYETISAGGAESCDCAGCRNFLAQRDSVYPAEVLNLFDELGVN